MYYPYIIKNKINEKLYTESNNNLKQRLQEHNNMKARSTASRTPFLGLDTMKYFLQKTMSIKDGRAFAQLRHRIRKSLL